MSGGLRFPFLAQFLAVFSLSICPSLGGSTEPQPLNRAYAVFVAHYNPQTQEAVGGVMGTAFFVSKSQARTAFHVLQPKSFQPMPGFTQVRVWLVHEGEPALRLDARDLTYNSELDSTEIRLTTSQVKTHFVYSVSSQIDLQTAGSVVESEGFRVNSVGPRLQWMGSEIEVMSVPKLERLYARGSVLRSAQIDLKANDVTLQSAPCIQLSYEPIKGFSGGPVVHKGRVVAMNSFADPKTRQQTWALLLN
ncbi:MAG: hypothetical protein AB7F86_09870 [Bdellovibrionales bacterium]